MFYISTNDEVTQGDYTPQSSDVRGLPSSDNVRSSS